eukprot:2087273-Amphidinium_carterae.1
MPLRRGPSRTVRCWTWYVRAAYGAALPAYLGQDRVDIAETVKCLVRAMAKPREGHMAQLKRLARYLKVRCCQPEAAVAAYVDSDWAGDPVTRRSTTGMLLLNQRCLCSTRTSESPSRRETHATH